MSESKEVQYARAIARLAMKRQIESIRKGILDTEMGHEFLDGTIAPVIDLEIDQAIEHYERDMFKELFKDDDSEQNRVEPQ